MRKKIFVSLVILFVALSFAGCFFGGQNIQPRYQHKYLPKQFRNIYLGMPFDEFKKLKDAEKMEKLDALSFRITYVEQPKDADIKEVSYYFDVEPNPEKPLYEIIVEYKPEFDLDAFISRTYGSPNHDDEWRFDSKEGFDIMVWTFDSKLVIAGKIAGTEWESQD